MNGYLIKAVERIRFKRHVRCDADEDWVTIKGTHVLIGENGEALSGGKLKGLQFSRAKSVKSREKSNQASQGMKAGKNFIKMPLGRFKHFGNYEVDIGGEPWKYMASSEVFVRFGDNEILTAEEYRKKYGDEVNIKLFKDDKPTYLDFMNIVTKSAEQRLGDPVTLAEKDLDYAKMSLKYAEESYKRNPSEYAKIKIAYWQKDVDACEEKIKREKIKKTERAEYLSAVIQAYEATGQSILRPDEFVGNKRGNEMSHEEADSGKVNPNYDPGSTAYTNNCQTCVVAYEARLRGYDLEAGAFTVPGPLYELSKASHKAWVDPTTGKEPVRIEPRKEDDLHDGDSCKDWLTNQMQEGARYTIRMTWKGTHSGHVICCHKKDGKVVLYDPQNNQSYEDDASVSSYLNRAEPESLGLVRVDNMMMNPLVLEGCFAKKAYRRPGN